MGNNLLDNKVNYAINYIDNQFQVIGDKYLVQYDDKTDKVTGVYDIQTDYSLKYHLKNYDIKTVTEMQTYLKAFLQDYSIRMSENRLSYQREAPN